MCVVTVLVFVLLFDGIVFLDLFLRSAPILQGYLRD